MKNKLSFKVMLILLLTICCQYGWAAETRDYTLNQTEVTGAGKVEVASILGSDNKPTTIKLIIAGLGTNHITAQCAMLSLSIETQIYPMDKPDNGTGDDGAQWYYVRYNLGVTIIELKGDTVKIYNLGDAPYTFIGTRSSASSSVRLGH